MGINWFPTLTTEPQYTKGTSNDVYWTSGTSSGGPPFSYEFKLEACESSVFYSDDLITNEDVSIVDENAMVSGSDVNLIHVYTKHSPKSVQGVWLTSDTEHTGTNYYTSGSGFVINEIRLATALPSSTETVLVSYTRSGWTPRYFDTISGLEHSTKYFYRVRARDTARVETSGTRYVYSTQDNKVDYLKITSPVGKEVWHGDTTEEITWKAYDDDSKLSSDGATLYYSMNSGEDWTELASGEDNTNDIEDESQTSTTAYRIYTNYDIKEVDGIWSASDANHSGTNYYTNPAASGSSSFEGREIVLAAPLPSTKMGVLIDYTTYGKYSWSIPDTLDSENWRIKISVEDNVGNAKSDSCSSDFVIFTPKNRFSPIYNAEDDSNLGMILNTFINETNRLVDNVLETRRQIPISNAENSILDLHASTYGLIREDNETDEELRDRIENIYSAARNTRAAIQEAIDPFRAVGSSVTICEWMGAPGDWMFYLDNSFLGWSENRISAGYDYGDDPYTFEIWIRPYSTEGAILEQIADTINNTKPAGTLCYARILSGEKYSSFTYGSGVKYGAGDY